MTLKHLTAVGLVAWSLSPSVRAEEGASGHYVPGAMSDFIDTMPGKTGFVFANAFTYYDGNASPQLPIDFAGRTTLDAHATLQAYTLYGLYQTPLQLLGGSYAAAITLPYVWLEVEGNVTAGPVTRPTRDTANGLSDLTLYPFLLGWTNELDMKYDVRFGVYAPSGEYDSGKLANVGKNYWTFEPSASFSWLSTKIGTEATVFVGMDFNTENDETHYQSGTSVHVDGTLAQHLPLFGGFAGVGANGFYYQQITGDSGSGATLGDFEGRTAGVGPVASYARKIGTVDFAGEIKWLPELDREKRLKGDYVWVKVGIVF